MLNSLNRFRRDRRGAAAIEFGLLVPLFMMFLLGVVEFGRVLAQSNAVEKGVRAGVALAVRSDNPIIAASAQETAIKNLVRYGNTAGTGSVLVDGWSGGSGTVAISVVRTYSGGGVTGLDVIRIDATVAYTPLIPGLFSFAGLNSFNILVDHEQAYIGN